MTTDELRAKFEAHFSQPPYEWEFVRLSATSAWPDRYSPYYMQCAWEGWQAAYASRDAEVEALRKDAERWRSLVAENNKGRHGKFRICWLDSSREGFITTDGVSCDGKDEEAIVRIFDAAMREESK